MLRLKRLLEIVAFFIARCFYLMGNYLKVIGRLRRWLNTSVAVHLSALQPSQLRHFKTTINVKKPDLFRLGFFYALQKSIKCYA